MKLIPLACGAAAIVDDCDYLSLSSQRWCLFNKYAGRYEGDVLVLMHRLINETPKGLFTDHINGNTLDNRRSNLRTATASQNMMNRRTRRKGALVKGAWFDGSGKQLKRWRASIEIAGRRKYLGRFHTEQEAADAYAAAARELQGEFAHISTGATK